MCSIAGSLTVAALSVLTSLPSDEGLQVNVYLSAFMRVSFLLDRSIFTDFCK